LLAGSFVLPEDAYHETRRALNQDGDNLAFGVIDPRSQAVPANEV
jgi:hypothetical protein